MPKIRTIADANAALMAYAPATAKLKGAAPILDENRPLFAALDNPQNRLRVVHVAGTSGKTSTAYFIAALLKAGGQKVGLTVSPHVDSVTERVQVDGRPLADERFCEYLSEFLDIVQAGRFEPSYFSLLVAFSFWVFEREGVDYAVVETGLGGRYDTTNLADRTDKLCVVTDIGFDHMNVLGDTIGKISYQKAGIIHAGNPVIMYRQASEVNKVVARQVQEQGAELVLTNEAAAQADYAGEFSAAVPAYQRRNWLLAYTVYQFLRRRDSLPELAADQLAATQLLQVPGRMDVRRVGGKTIVMDGAHNGQKMATFLQSFQTVFPRTRPAVMIALKEGKEPADVVPLLAPIASRIIVTTFETSQDLPVRSIDPAQLARLFGGHAGDDIHVVPDHQQAYQQLLAGPEDVCVITGSFYLLSQVRQAEGLA